MMRDRRVPIAVVRAAILRVLRHALAVVLVLFVATACDDGKNKYVAPPPPKVTVSKPEVRTVTENLEFTGTTAAFATVKLVARVQGYLEKIHFIDGTMVKKGDLLFTIQQEQYKAQLQQALAEVAASKAKLENAVTEYDRYLSLYKQRAGPATLVDQWKYTKESAAAALESAQAQVILAKLNLGYTTITAPFDGQMGRHLIYPGNLVGGGGGGQDTILAEINQIDPLYVYFTINERDLLRVIAERGATRREGTAPKDARQAVFMALAGEKGYPHQGVVDFAAITANPQTGTLQLRGIFPNPKGDIFPGLFARVQAPFQQTKDAILVPADAVGFDQQGYYVLVVGDKNVVERRQVEIGEQFGEMRVLKSGLAADERVVVDGLLRAVPGREVTPEEAGKPAAAPPAGSVPRKSAVVCRTGGTA